MIGRKSADFLIWLVNLTDSVDCEMKYHMAYITVLQSAVVKETMRISSPAPGRFPRVVPPEGVHHKSSFIPGGVSRLILFEIQ
jgi:hypothetical protein